LFPWRHVRPGSLDTVVVELATLVVVKEDVVGLSIVVVPAVVVDSDGPIEDVRDVELVKEPADVDADDVVSEISDVEDSVFVEDVTAVDVDVILVDTTAVGVADVELSEVGDSEVLDNDVTADVEAVVAVGVTKVVDVVEDSAVVIDVGEVDDVSVSVEDTIAADVDVALVDTTSVGVVDVALRESSEVLEKEATGDVDSVEAGGVRAVGVLETSIDVSDELGGVSVCDSIVGGATEVNVDSRLDSELKADAKEEFTTVELSIC